ncbi:MAG TPA: A24 family peptidase [Pseudolabrys sp.]|nr:A24 family peptidase [Pseudolabrys sp.]
MTVAEVRLTLLAIASLLLVLAAVRDLRSRIIPNGLVISVASSGLLFGAISRPYSLWISIVAALLVLVVLSALSHLGTLGGGDVKLMAAATLLVAPAHIAGLLMAIVVMGGAVSAIYLALGWALRRLAQPARSHHRRTALSRWWDAERRRIEDSRTVPYALAISSGSITFIFAEWYRCLSVTSCSL